MKKKKIYNIFFTIFSICFILSSLFLLYKIIKTNNTKKEIEKSKLSDEVIKENAVEKTIDNLKIEYNNNDIIGILSIPNLFNTPVVQTTDNTYYLIHSLNKDYSVIGNVFLDYRNSINAKQLNFYGHNSGKYDPPFRKLQNYLNEDFYNNNKIIELRVLNEVRTYEIFSVKIVEKSSKEEHMNFEYIDNATWLEHLNKLKNNSLYQTKTILNESDNIIVLQTCIFGINDGKLLIVVGKQIPN